MKSTPTMNRRSIFKLIAGAACAAAIELTGMTPSLPKAAKYKVNPDWENAPFEYGIDTSDKSCLTVIRFQKSSGNNWMTAWKDKTFREYFGDMHPSRYVFVDGKYHLVPRFVLDL